MLRILPLADDLILPQAKQEIYFFNRIGPKLTVDKRLNHLKQTANFEREMKPSDNFYDPLGLI